MRLINKRYDKDFLIKLNLNEQIEIPFDSLIKFTIMCPKMEASPPINIKKYSDEERKKYKEMRMFNLK